MNGRFVAIVDPREAGASLAPELSRHGIGSVAVSSGASGGLYAGLPVERVARELAGAELVLAGNESGVLLADALSERLGLPTNGTRLSLARRDKGIMAEVVAAAGIRVPPVHRARDVAEGVAWAVRRDAWPVVVKPRRGYGSRGVWICGDAEQVARAATDVLALPEVFGTELWPPERAEGLTALLVQACVHGDEYVVDTVSWEGRHSFCGLWRYGRPARRPGLVELFDTKELLASSDPLATPLIAALFAYACRVLDALGIRYGAAHTELILGSEGPLLVETGARLHGGEAAHRMCRLATGDSQLDRLVRVVADSTSLQGDFPGFVGRTVMVPLKVSCATVREQGLLEIAALGSLRDLRMNVAAGEKAEGVAGLVTLQAEESSTLETDLLRLRRIEAESLYARVGTAPEVIERRVISTHPRYHGWPTLCRRRNGRLIVVTSGGREEHTCPFGQIWAMASDDDGASWTGPRVLVNGLLDERDPGLFETSRGTLILTWFNSVQWIEVLDKLSAGDTHVGLDRLGVVHWEKLRRLLGTVDVRPLVGVWTRRSEDGGETWSETQDSVVCSAHGPIELSDGRLFHVGMRGLAPGEPLLNGFARGGEFGAAESTDDGRSWRWLGALPVRPGDSPAWYVEPSAVETDDGQIVVQVRFHRTPDDTPELLQLVSSDGGKRWTVPENVGFFGFPAHLLRLRDGRLLTTYGHRRPPFGVQVRFSSNSGRDWSEALILSDDGVGRDLGYPTTVQLADDTLLTVWYDRVTPTSPAVLRQARWRLGAGPR